MTGFAACVMAAPDPSRGKVSEAGLMPGGIGGALVGLSTGGAALINEVALQSFSPKGCMSPAKWAAHPKMTASPPITLMKALHRHAAR